MVYRENEENMRTNTTTKRLNIAAFGLLAGALVLSGCETEDNRPGIPEPDTSARKLGELCEVGGMPACDTGLSCYTGGDMMGQGTCIPDRFATACRPNPCGEGLCIGRGDPNVTTFCNCPGGSEWDGFTCVDGGPGYQGDVTAGTTCPQEELAPGVPDDATADCPPGSFCTSDSGGGDCLEFNFAMSGTLNGGDFDVTATSSAAESDLSCVRGAEGAFDLVIGGDTASAIVDGANEITISVFDNDALGGGSLLIWPQDSVDSRQGDAASVDVDVDGTSASAVGGDFTIVDVVDVDPGAVGGTFYIGLPGTEFVTGRFIAPCPAPAAE